MELININQDNHSILGRFGIELTFTSAEMILLASTRDTKDYYTDSEEYTNLYISLLKQWSEEILKLKMNDQNYKEIKVIPMEKDKYGFDQISIELPSKQILNLHYDDWVFEIGASPYTQVQFKNDLQVIQKVIFDIANKLGLSPHSRIGCGHIHLEYISYFNSDILLFRNFIVDLFNRPYLFLGALSLDLLNAPPVSILSKTQQEILVKVIKEFDSLAEFDKTIARLGKDINDQVYYQTYIQGNDSGELEFFRKNQNKFQAINLKNSETIEIRGLRPQKNSKEVLLLIYLFEGRINELKKIKSPINLNLVDLVDKVSWTTLNNIENYEVRINPLEILNSLKNYCKDSNVEFVEGLITDELREKLY